MIHEIVTDSIMSVGVDGDLELRSDAIGARYEHRLGDVGRHAKHSAESAKLTARAGGERRQHM
jgi:hypothetical protein